MTNTLRASRNTQFAISPPTYQRVLRMRWEWRKSVILGAIQPGGKAVELSCGWRNRPRRWSVYGQEHEDQGGMNHLHYAKIIRLLVIFHREWNTIVSLFGGTLGGVMSTKRGEIHSFPNPVFSLYLRVTFQCRQNPVLSSSGMQLVGEDDDVSTLSSPSSLLLNISIPCEFSPYT